MVTKYGMSEKIGPISFGQDNDEVFLGKEFGHVRNYSEQVAAQIDEEVERIISEAYERTEKILTEHIDKLHSLASVLLKKDKVEKDEFLRIMSGDYNPDDEKPDNEDIHSDEDNDVESSSEETFSQSE